MTELERNSNPLGTVDSPTAYAFVQVNSQSTSTRASHRTSPDSLNLDDGDVPPPSPASEVTHSVTIGKAENDAKHQGALAESQVVAVSGEEQHMSPKWNTDPSCVPE